MQLAFCLYKYFPYGGLQRDFMRIAELCHQRGHSIRVYTLAWEGNQPSYLDIRIPRVKAVFNHNRYRKFYNWLQRDLTASPVDCVIGFNKMPGLDVYYAADPCFLDKVIRSKPFWYNYTTRYRHFLTYEKAVFENSPTHILILSPQQQQVFNSYYHTPAARFHLLPPGIAADRIAPPNAKIIRAAVRQELNLKADDYLLLMIGSGFKTKGLDRALYAMHALPAAIRNKTQFIVIGKDNPKPFLALIKKLKLQQQVKILLGRDDIPKFLLAADLLLHPAYSEAYGIVLLEALVAGLPVLATDICGFSFYIEAAQAGQLITSPFKQENLNKQLLTMLTSAQRSVWQANAIRFSQQQDLYSMHEQAVTVIEQLAHSRSVL